MDKFAAVDLGTNTFHLLVASFNEDGSLEEHYRQRNYVHLAMEGIDTIADEAYTKAVECIREFTAALNNFKIKSVHVQEPQLYERHLTVHNWSKKLRRLRVSKLT